MSFLQIASLNLGLALLAMLLIWLVSLVRRDASIVDPFWGCGFVLLCWYTALNLESWGPRVWLILGMVTVWGLRLSIYLLWRNHGKGEDRRYAAMRQKHGRNFWWFSLLSVFGLQGAIMWFVSLTFQTGMYFGAATALTILDGAGIAVWFLGVFFETVSDYQMARFKDNPDNRGKVMNRGLWRYSRHPNYFGDFCVWWGLYLLAVASGAWWAILSPLAMSLLLLKVSGVTLLESDIEERRPEYRQYKRQTNAFFPGPARA